MATLRVEKCSCFFPAHDKNAVDWPYYVWKTQSTPRFACELEIAGVVCRFNTNTYSKIGLDKAIIDRLRALC